MSQSSTTFPDWFPHEAYPRPEFLSSSLASKGSATSKQAHQQLAVFYSDNIQMIEKASVMDISIIATSTTMPSFSQAVKAILYGLVLLAYAHPIFADIVMESQWVISLLENSRKNETEALAASKKQLLSMICGLFRFSTIKDTLTGPRREELHRQFLYSLDSIENDLKRYEELLQFMDREVQVDVLHIKIGDLRLAYFIRTFALRRAELDIIAISYGLLDAAALTIAVEVTEQQAAAIEQPADLSSRPSPVESSQLQEERKRVSTGELAIVAEVESTSAQTSLEDETATLVLKIGTLRPETDPSLSPDEEALDADRNSFGNPSGPGTEKTPSLSRHGSVQSYPSATFYSTASSRTLSTDYGIYARRLAISQDTILSAAVGLRSAT